MTFYALTPRCFPAQIAHPNDTHIDWKASAIRMGLYEEPKKKPDAEFESKADEAEFKKAERKEAAKLFKAMLEAKQHYANQFNVEDLVAEEGKEIRFFSISIIEADALSRANIRVASEAGKRGDKTTGAADMELHYWAYKNYVEPPKGFGFPESVKTDMGRCACALSVTSISTAPEDDVGK